MLTPYQQDLGLLRSFQLVRIRHVMPFALAATVAIGAGALSGGGGRAWLRSTIATRRIRAIGLGGAIGLVIGSQVVLAALRLWRAFRRANGLGTADIGWLLALASIVVGILVVAIALRGLRRDSRVGGTMVAIAIVLFAADRVLFAHGERLSSGALGTYEGSIAMTSGQAFILAQGAPEANRVLTIGDAGDRMGAVGLFQADGYQAIYPLGFHDLFGTLIAPQLAADPGLYRYFWSWGVRAYSFGPVFDPEIADLLGVRWVYVRGGASLGAGYVERFRDGGVVVYENPDPLPRAFVAPAVAEQTTRAGMVDALGRASRDQLAGTAWILHDDVASFGADLAAGSSAAQDAAGGGQSREAEMTVYTPDRIELSVPDGPAGVLVVTDTLGPGWQASVDGAVTPVGAVDLAFRGVALAGGPHSVVLRYVPLATYLGLVLAALAAVATSAGALAVRRIDRRRFGLGSGHPRDEGRTDAVEGR
jgi:hypothetical protein